MQFSFRSYLERSVMTSSGPFAKDQASLDVCCYDERNSRKNVLCLD